MNRYIELNSDKSPKTNFDTFYTSTENLENAGLILDNETIIVDFDIDSEVAITILNNIPTKALKTSRGYHLYFKVPKNFKGGNGTNITTILGNKVDYKTGYKNKKAYGIVKLNGVNREVINEHITDYPYLPIMLYPTTTTESLYHLSVGSRNNLLFKHLLNVLDVINDTKALYAIASTINNNFNEPLELREVESVVDSAIKNKYSKDNIFDVNDKGGQTLNIFKLAQLLEKELNITLFNNRLYFKIDGVYTNNETTLLRYILNKGINLKKKDDTELLHQLTKTNNVINTIDFPIVLNNGYSIYDGEVIESDCMFSPYTLDVAYVPNAYDEDVDSFLNWFCSNDVELRELIEEIIGHIFMGSGKPAISNFFYGAKGKNGKSTFFNMIFNLVGELGESLALEELQKIEYIAKLFGKLVNCGDDIDDGVIPQSRTFKNLVSGNRLMIREYYKAPVSFNNQATLIFSCNEIPKFKDKSGGLERRINIFPCLNIVNKIDSKIDYKLSTANAKSYLINLALQGIKRIKDNDNTMTKPKVCDNITAEYILDSDSVRQFLNYRDSIHMPIDNVKDITIYNSFKLFCEDEGLAAYSKSKFSRRLKDFNYITKQSMVNGISCKVYVKGDVDID